jgi:hypothetical protein
MASATRFSREQEGDDLQRVFILKTHGAAVGGGEAGLLRRRSKACRPAAISAIVMMKTANFRGLHDGRAASAGTFLVRFIPSGVASNAQEIYSARIKPSDTVTAKTVIAEVRSSWPESKSDAASISNHAITT